MTLIELTFLFSHLARVTAVMSICEYKNNKRKDDLDGYIVSVNQREAYD